MYKIPLASFLHSRLYILGHTLLAAIGAVIFYASLWFITVCIARLSGGAVEVGRFALAMAIVNPVVLLFSLALRAIIVTDVEGVHTWRDYCFARALGCACQVGFVQAICLVLNYDAAACSVITAMSIAKVAEQFMDLCHAFLQRESRFDVIARSMTLRAFLGAAAFLALYWPLQKLPQAIYAMGASWALVVLFHDVPAVRAYSASLRAGFLDVNESEKSTWAATKGLIRRSLPLGWALTLLSLNESAPRYVISFVLGEEQVGVFSAMAYILTAQNVLFVAVVQVLSTRLASAGFNADFRLVGRLIGVLCVAATAIGMAGVVFSSFLGDDFLLLVYGDAFSRHSDAFVSIMWAGFAGLFASAFISISASLHVISPLPFVISFAAMINISLGYALCMRYGIPGAAIGWTVSNTAISILLAFCVRRWRRNLKGQPALQRRHAAV